MMVSCNYVYMFYLIDWSTFIVIATVILSNLTLMVLYKVRLNIRIKLLDVKDKRLDFFKNVIKNLKYIKMRAWENFYYFRIFQLREQEMYYYKVTAVLVGIIYFITWMCSVLPEVLVFMYQAYIKADLYDYAALSAFIQICHNLTDVMVQLPDAVNRLFDIYISSKRIEEFF